MQKDVYDRIHAKLLKLCPDLLELKPGDYRKSSSGGFMDLHLDVLEKTEHEMRISLAHNYQQNGDTMADSDMEIKVYLFSEWPKAEALTYQQDGLGIYQEVYPAPGRVYPKLKTQLNSFLDQWLTNCINQKHKLKENCQKESQAYSVNFKDLTDPQKNHGFSLSPRDILHNDKIPKRRL